MKRLLMCIPILVAGCAGSHQGTPAPTPTALPQDRRAADRMAKDAFLDLNFFADGRGMHMNSGLIASYKRLAWTGIYDDTITRKWGVNKVDGQVIGLSESRFENQRIGVAGCAMCHTGKAAGQIVVGLGNKNIDTVRFGSDVAGLERLHAALTFTNLQKRPVDASAIDFARRISNRDIGNLTQGLVPVSFIREWFYTQANEPLPPDMRRGAVKVPALWGYGLKKEVGQFCDGYGNGRRPGWIIGVELSAGQTSDTVRSYAPKIKAAENLISAMLPPLYPFAIDRSAAERGAKVFSAHCTECHGFYRRDAAGLPSYRRPKWIPHDAVGTDPDRLDSNTQRFNELVDRSPLHDLIQRNTERRGYIAPRLEGIWCRFPYLHNGSVPSIASLLTLPEQRPVVFSMHEAGERERFDEQALGLTQPTGQEMSRMMKRGAKGDRAIYDTRRIGQSNHGHDFGSSLREDEKRDLIEYLKTL